MLYKIKKYINHKGFTIIELITVMCIISILVVIAISKFSDATTTANTAKIATDLSTIDYAIVIYKAQGHTLVGATVGDLVSNGQLAVEPKTPSGYYFLDEKKSDTTLNKGVSYLIDSNSGRSYLNNINNTADQFHN